MAEIDKEAAEKLQELQILESTFQNLLMQKQTFQLELNEINTAIEEVDKSRGDIFKIIGQIMIKADKNITKKELEEKKKILGLRTKTLEKQELSLRENVERLRGDIVEKIK